MGTPRLRSGAHPIPEPSCLAPAPCRPLPRAAGSPYPQRGRNRARNLLFLLGCWPPRFLLHEEVARPTVVLPKILQAMTDLSPDKRISLTHNLPFFPLPVHFWEPSHVPSRETRSKVFLVSHAGPRLSVSVTFLPPLRSRLLITWPYEMPPSISLGGRDPNKSFRQTTDPSLFFTPLDQIFHVRLKTMTTRST